MSAAAAASRTRHHLAPCDGRAVVLMRISGNVASHLFRYWCAAGQPGWNDWVVGFRWNGVSPATSADRVTDLSLRDPWPPSHLFEASLARPDPPQSTARVSGSYDGEIRGARAACSITIDTSVLAWSAVGTARAGMSYAPLTIRDSDAIRHTPCIRRVVASMLTLSCRKHVDASARRGNGTTPDYAGRR
jgi:hypothetical protein